jgi:hypothetical protein
MLCFQTKNKQEKAKLSEHPGLNILKLGLASLLPFGNFKL